MSKRFSEPDDERKPSMKRKRRGAGRFSHHTCFHHDWWNGCLGMSPEEVGIYERLYKLMYIRRAALADNDKELAQLCHCDVRTYKRIKAKLIARGRIVQDEELGLLYDERTIRELVDSGFLSEAQTRRAMKRHTKTPVETVVDERARSAVGNVVELRPDKILSVAQVLRKVGRISDSSLTEVDTVIGENQTDGCANGHANQYPSPIAHPTKSKNPEPPAPRAAMPPGGGGAPDAEERERRKAEFFATLSPQEQQQHLADQAARLGLTDKGKEATERDETASPDDLKVGDLMPGVDPNEHRNRLIDALSQEPSHHDEIGDHVPHFAPDRITRRR